MSVLHIIIPSYMNQPKLVVYKYNRSHYVPLKRAIELFFDDVSPRSQGFLKFTNKISKRPMPVLGDYINDTFLVDKYYGGKKIHPKTNFCTITQFVLLFKSCYRAYNDFNIKTSLRSLEGYATYLLDLKPTKEIQPKEAQPKDTQPSPQSLKRIVELIHADNKRQAIEELKRSDEIKRIASWAKDL